MIFRRRDAFTRRDRSTNSTRCCTGVVRLAERPVREDDDAAHRKSTGSISMPTNRRIRATIEESPHSLLPVAEGRPTRSLASSRCATSWPPWSPSNRSISRDDGDQGGSGARPARCRRCAARAAIRPISRWPWCMTNMATRRDRDTRSICSPRWSAISPAIRIRATRRGSSSAAMARCWSRARYPPMPRRPAGHRIWRGPRVRHRGWIRAPPCSKSCPWRAATSPTKAGRSKWSTWTVAGSIS